MKKLALTIAIVLGLSMASFAQGGGFFQRGTNDGSAISREDTPGLPGHGGSGNADATPLGSGIVVLMGLGAAYLVGKKHNED